MYTNPILEEKVLEQIVRLNQKWFDLKLVNFKSETFINKDKTRIQHNIKQVNSYTGDDFEDIYEEEEEINIDIDFAKYSWNSDFPDSNSRIMGDEQSNNQNMDDFALSSSNICWNLIELIESQIKNFTDCSAINTIIVYVRDIVISEVQKMEELCISEEYKNTLDFFIDKFRDELRINFSHILRQLKIIGSIEYEKELTIEICSKIVEFKIGNNNRKFISSATGQSKGASLLYLLSENPKTDAKIKIYIDDWGNQDVYYLINRLNQIYPEQFKISWIEDKKSLYLKSGNMFERTGFDNFRSNRLSSYLNNSNRAQIEIQLSKL
jgi:hypothetical protein